MARLGCIRCCERTGEEGEFGEEGVEKGGVIAGRVGARARPSDESLPRKVSLLAGPLTLVREVADKLS